jgi:NtrC-family two-component system sensor histidine kinase KinB
VATTVATGAWSALTFARLSAAADDALRASQEKIDLTAELAGSLEREDDALLLALSGDLDRAERDLDAERRRGDACHRRLLAVLADGDGEGQALARELKREMDAYRAAGSRLIAGGRGADALERYHRDVNPRLRRAVLTCGKVREENVSSLRLAGADARDQAGRATWVVAVASVAAVVLATVVSVWLARSFLVPVRALTESVEAVRQGDFDRRVSAVAVDELGQLAAGFNRMAETLAEYRRSSLGDLLTAKMTLEATLNALPDAVLVVAPDGTLAALNPPARAVLLAMGVPEAQRLQELPLRPEHRDAVDAALAGRPSVRARTDFNLALTAALNGRPRRFLLTAAPIPEFAPRQFGAVLLLDDVTEFVRLDELRGELIGMASHELKTPLTALQLNLLLLGEGATALTPSQREMLDAALRGCQELAGTIDELLDVTRVEAGQLRLDFAPVDLAAILDHVLRGLRPRFDDAHVQVRALRDVEQALVRGDPARLSNVLTNLLTNALKYSPPGGTVTVRISSGQNAEPGAPPALQLTVMDKGPGVPPEFRERVFEKFFRVEHQLGGPKRARGTGIGLYLCREIVKAHGGSIRCEAGEGGVGTRIALLLPVDTARAEGLGGQEAAARDHQPPTAP